MKLPKIDGIIGASDDDEIYEYSISDKFLVVCGSQIEVFPDEGSADSRCLEHALHGNACTKIWPTCSPDYPEGWPDEDFAPLDSSKIISYIGQKNYDDLVADADDFGYSWFYNLQEGDPDTIYETIGWGFPSN